MASITECREYTLARLPQLSEMGSEEGIIRWETYPITPDELLGYDDIIAFLYKDSSVNHDEHHGSDHILRGLIHVLKLSRYFQKKGIPIDETVAVWSYILHDAGSNHHDVPDHGEKGADLIAPLVVEWLSPHQSQQIINNVRWHNKSPDQVPSNVFTIEHAVMRTADSLELLRLGDERDITLLLGEALQLAPQAAELIRQTTLDSSQREYGHVLRAAVEVGLVVA